MCIWSLKYLSILLFISARILAINNFFLTIIYYIYLTLNLNQIIYLQLFGRQQFAFTLLPVGGARTHAKHSCASNHRWRTSDVTTSTTTRSWKTRKWTTVKAVTCSKAVTRYADVLLIWSLASPVSRSIQKNEQQRYFSGHFRWPVGCSLHNVVNRDEELPLRLSEADFAFGGAT